MLCFSFLEILFCFFILFMSLLNMFKHSTTFLGMENIVTTVSESSPTNSIIYVIINLFLLIVLLIMGHTVLFFICLVLFTGCQTLCILH